MQELLGVDEPDYGGLLDRMVVEDGDEIAMGRLLQPRIEAELAFVMAQDLVSCRAASPHPSLSSQARPSPPSSTDWAPSRSTAA
jgi:2-keto-4-pentenoate hydratase